jgi:hypothetical protein
VERNPTNGRALNRAYNPRQRARVTLTPAAPDQTGSASFSTSPISSNAATTLPQRHVVKE